MQRRKLLTGLAGILGIASIASTAYLAQSTYRMLSKKPRKYYRSGPMECMKSALANLILEQGDEKAARKIFDKYNHHPLVLDDGSVTDLVLTRLVSDLTDEEYEAIYFGNVIGDFSKAIQEHYGPKTEDVIKIFMNERQKGRIKSLDEADYNPPLICLLKVFNDETYITHTAVYLGGNQLLNNGEIRHYPINRIKVLGILKLRKK